MTLPAPYFGRNIDDVLSETDRFFDEYNRSIPKEDLDGFNPRVRGYGTLWAELYERPSIPGVYVIGGVSGNMSGVPVAHFNDRDVAKRYAKDFGEGRVMALENGDRWTAFINAAHKTKGIDADRRSHLLSLSRKTGILNGRELTISEVRDLYENGSL